MRLSDGRRVRLARRSRFFNACTLGRGQYMFWSLLMTILSSSPKSTLEMAGTCCCVCVAMRNLVSENVIGSISIFWASSKVARSCRPRPWVSPQWLNHYMRSFCCKTLKVDNKLARRVYWILVDLSCRLLNIPRVIVTTTVVSWCESSKPYSNTKCTLSEWTLNLGFRVHKGSLVQKFSGSCYSLPHQEQHVLQF